MVKFILMDSFLLIVAALFIYKIRLKKANDSYLSKPQTDSLRGILAVGIFFHHFSGWFFELSPAYYLFNHVGSFLVSIFFFLSGYGLLYGLQNKKNYIKKFPQKKFFAIILPYWICVLLYSAWYLYRNEISAKDFGLAFIFQNNTVKYSWFVPAIATMYLAFFLSCLLCDKALKNRKYIIPIFFILQLVSLFLDFSWITSALNITVGMLWFKYKEKIDCFVLKRYWSIMIINAVLFAAVAVPKYLFLSTDNSTMMNISDALSGILFTVMIINLLRKVEFTNKFTSFISKISYEIYLLHGLSIEVCFAIVGRDNPLLFGAMSLAVTVILSFIVNSMTKMNTKVGKKLKII